MKKIIATIIGIVTMLFGLYNLVGNLNTAVDFINATSPAFQGDYENATNNVVDVGTQYIVDIVYWAVIMAILSPFIALFIGLLKKL